MPKNQAIKKVGRTKKWQITGGGSQTREKRHSLRFAAFSQCLIEAKKQDLPTLGKVIHKTTFINLKSGKMQPLVIYYIWL